MTSAIRRMFQTSPNTMKQGKWQGTKNACAQIKSHVQMDYRYVCLNFLVLNILLHLLQDAENIHNSEFCCKKLSKNAKDAWFIHKKKSMKTARR